MRWWIAAIAVLALGGCSSAVTPTAPATGQWERKVPGGECECADGSQFSFYTRTGDPTKVVFYLAGGGACWSAATCAPDSGNRYKTTAEPPSREGIFDLTDPRNPFAGYSFVVVPYCTADVHLGDATTTYAPGLTIHHHGYANGTAALKEMVADFPRVADVVVIGASAGSVAAPFYAGLVADRMPAAHVTSIADSSGSYPDSPAMNRVLTGSAWNAGPILPQNASLPGLVIAGGKRHPGIVFGRIDHLQDADQKFHLKLVGVPAGDLPGLLRATQAEIEKAGVTLHSYTSPGEGHVVVDESAFYPGVRDWVAHLLETR
jgi:hypothetical protein